MGLILRVVKGGVSIYIEVFVTVVERKRAVVFAVYTDIISCSGVQVGPVGLVLFQPDIDDARIARRLIFGGRMRNDLNGLHSGRLQGLQVVGQGSSRQISGTAIHIHLHAVLAANAQVIQVVYFQTRTLAQ
jgi:hypothetical protein